MPQRFLIKYDAAAKPPSPGTELTVDSERSHYLTHVMRVPQGGTIQCFDGQGAVFKAELAGLKRKRATLRITEVEPPATKPQEVHIGLALLKGQAMDRAIAQATELGATITLLHTQRVNVRLNAQRLDAKLHHWQKIIDGACEQCGRLYVPTLSPPRTLERYVSEVRERTMTPIVLHMDAPRLSLNDARGSVACAVGPEGGWDQRELAWCENNHVERRSLATHTLRAETTPAVALGILAHARCN